MTKVITYGTFDQFHYGHKRLLERAKALGDYLIVGVTAEDFDKARGKINVRQSLMERIEAVRKTGLADEIIVEEYEGQKIDDVRRYNIDIFTVGSDWAGTFDYLREFCQVIYLERTEGISSSVIRSEKRRLKMGFVGDSVIVKKFMHESQFVNGIEIVGLYSNRNSLNDEKIIMTDNYNQLLDYVDAVYIESIPQVHYDQIRQALERGKHVLCESPISLKEKECKELFQLAENKNCILMDSIKTAYSTAYSRLLLLVKTEKIGTIYSVDAACTSLQEADENSWNSVCAWGPTALLPIFDLLGTEYHSKSIISHLKSDYYDQFTKINFVYDHAVASIKVGKGVKTEGELIISGTEGYIYVPAPWWKTDYFEIRYEDQTRNQRYFYQLDGEGIRYELVAFCKAVEMKKDESYISRRVSNAICRVIEDFYEKVDFYEI